MNKITNVIKKVIGKITYTTPSGTLNCRFCDNNLDNEGASQDMHAKDCIIHELREAING